MNRSSFRLLGLSLLAAFATLSPVMASTITGPYTVSAGSGSVTGAIAGNTLILNENITSINPAFGVGFDVLGSPGSTTYSVIKTVTNNTGFTWSTFEVASGCGSLGETSCGVFMPDYSASTPAYSGSGATLSTAPAYFIWSGVSIGPGKTATFTWSMDTCDSCSGTWQILQRASAAPEPDSLGLASAGLVLTAFGAIRVKRRTS
jgi:hypothetical protein